MSLPRTICVITSTWQISTLTLTLSQPRRYRYKQSSRTVRSDGAVFVLLDQYDVYKVSWRYDPHSRRGSDGAIHRDVLAETQTAHTLTWAQDTGAGNDNTHKHTSGGVCSLVFCDLPECVRIDKRVLWGVLRNTTQIRCWSISFSLHCACVWALTEGEYCTATTSGMKNLPWWNKRQAI